MASHIQLHYQRMIMFNKTNAPAKRHLASVCDRNTCVERKRVSQRVGGRLLSLAFADICVTRKRKLETGCGENDSLALYVAGKSCHWPIALTREEGWGIHFTSS